jgi:hypothetical protein
MNVLTGDDFYVHYHEDAYSHFGKLLSNDSQHRIGEAVDLLGRTMLGPQLSLVISAVPNFERRSISRMFAKTDDLHRYFKQHVYYDADRWNRHLEPLFSLLKSVVIELESNGFRDYWKSERYPLILGPQRELQAFIKKFQLDREIEFMLGQGCSPEEIAVFVCTFAAPHGIKICGPRVISDASFRKETTLAVVIHEMFHPPYDLSHLQEAILALGEDPLLKRTFRTKDPKYGYPTMEGFIEENVVEAMALFICQRLGLVKDQMDYLAKHDEGSHVLSLVLLSYFDRYPKPPEQSFEEYFSNLLKVLPIGSLSVEYEMLQKSGLKFSK